MSDYFFFLGAAFFAAAFLAGFAAAAALFRAFTGGAFFAFFGGGAAGAAAPRFFFAGFASASDASSPALPFFCSAGTNAVVRPPTVMNSMRDPFTDPATLPHRRWKSQS